MPTRRIIPSVCIAVKSFLIVVCPIGKKYVHCYQQGFKKLRVYTDSKMISDSKKLRAYMDSRMISDSKNLMASIDSKMIIITAI